MADEFSKKSSAQFKKTIVKEAVLKPAQTAYRLQNQHFASGDCVMMGQDSGGFPLSAKSVVIGLNSKTRCGVGGPVHVWYNLGITLGDRCILFSSFIFA